ncbi:MAG: hypothetical protein ACRDPT_16445 [Streptomycetales bacterium]
MTISIGILLLVGLWYCFIHRGTDWPGLTIGVALGVYAANTVLGDLVRGIVTGIATAITNAF